MTQQVQMQFRVGSSTNGVVRLGPEDRPGSVSSTTPEGRQVYLFGYWDGAPGVWRSKLGLDSEVGVDRQITTARLELLSSLDEPFELEVHVHGQAVTAIFTLVDDATSR